MDSFKFLGKINSPYDLKKLNYNELGELCDEIRQVLVDTVSQNGGGFNKRTCF